MEKTNFGFKALYSYHEDRKEEYLECAITSFKYALGSTGLDPACRATALFNLATSEFIRSQVRGTYSQLEVPIKLYEEALELRDSGHPDRPATSLLLAQARLSHLGQEYDESNAMRIWNLLAEIPHDGSCVYRTADAILRMRRFYQDVNSNPPQVHDLPSDMISSTYVLPYGYFDRPHVLHKMAIALWERFQQDTNIDDLKESIELNKEALHLIPDGHENQTGIVACLGKSFLRHVEAFGELTDVDMSADPVELAERVLTALDNMSLKKEELREQIVLILLADAAVQYVEQEVPPPDIPVIRSLIDEWGKDGVQTECKRQLGVLHSFLEGEGEIKMRALLAEVDWPFKEYKTKETVKVLQNHMQCFQRSFETKMGFRLANTTLIHDSVDNTFKVRPSWPSKARYPFFFSVQFKLPKFHLLRAVWDILERYDRVKEAIACFLRMENEQAEDVSLHERVYCEFGKWLCPVCRILSTVSIQRRFQAPLCRKA